MREFVQIVLQSRADVRRLRFWLPMVLWLVVEIYFLRGVYSACGGWGGSCHGRDCSEISGLMGIWGLPISIIVGLVFEALPIEGCNTAVFFAAALAFCISGFLQWYLIVLGVESMLIKLRRRFHAMTKGDNG